MWTCVALIAVVLLAFTALTVWALCSAAKRADAQAENDEAARRAQVDQVFASYHERQRDERQAGGPSSRCPACGWRHGYGTECGREA